MPEPGLSLAQIVIVDDEAPLMNALCDALGACGYATTAFTEGKVALEAIRKKQFDLLLTDLTMPEIDGITLLRAALQADPNLVAIVITGAGTIATAVEAMKAGALDYILKPFKLSVILPVVSRALAMRRLRLENAALEQCVRERTAELEDANRDLEVFAHSIAHDLRAPLRAMTGFSDILMRDYSQQIPADAQCLLSHVTASGQEMQQLIEDLLRLSRLGRQSLSKGPVSISELVREVLKELRDERESRDLEVHVGDLPDAVGDLPLLKQVFINLLSNAFKFTRHTKRAVVEVGWDLKDQDVVYFIRDNGAGFDMQYAEKLFGVFQRLHRSEEFEGTGIGLSIVYRIIKRHGGDVWAASEPNKGATFYLTLPS